MLDVASIAFDATSIASLPPPPKRPARPTIPSAKEAPRIGISALNIEVSAGDAASTNACPSTSSWKKIKSATPTATNEKVSQSAALAANLNAFFKGENPFLSSFAIANNFSVINNHS